MCSSGEHSGGVSSDTTTRDGVSVTDITGLERKRVSEWVSEWVSE